MAVAVFWVVWSVVAGFVVGVGLYISAPWIGAQLLGGRWRQRVGDWYSDQAQAAVYRGMIAVRKHQGLNYVQSSWDAVRGGERFAVGGEEKNVHDYRDRMKPWQGRPLGIAFEHLDLVTDPLHCRLAEVAHDAAQAGNLVWPKPEIDDRGNRSVRRLARDHFRLPLSGGLLDLRLAPKLQIGGAEADYSDEAYENAERSQEKFYDEWGVREGITFLAAFAVPLLSIWFVKNYGGSAAESAGSGIEQPLALAPVLEVVVVMLPW